MRVNFFINRHKTTSSLDRFGLCDNQPPSDTPAYIKETNPLEWIGIVNNRNRHDIVFYPIDHCVPLYRRKIVKTKIKNKIIKKIWQVTSDMLRLKERDNICDGMLFYNTNLIFVELKEKESSGWLKKGREQLTTTIYHFKRNNDITRYSKIEAYVCNKLRPLVNTGNTSHIQQFKDDTGLILNIKQEIDII